MTFLDIKTVVTEAHHPRSHRGSTLNENDRFQLVYNVYSDPRQHDSKIKGTHAQTNLVFLHGTGFSKDVWNYTIEAFFEHYGDALGTVIAFDTVNHCDSYMLNKGKVGWVCTWEDNGRDAIKIIKELDLKGGTILIGHSMGGASALHAAALERRVIDSVIAIEPVCYGEYEKFKSMPEVRKVYYRLILALNKAILDTFPSEKVFDGFMRKKNLTKTFHPRILDDLINSNKLVNPRTGETSFKTTKNMQLVSYASSILSSMYMPDIARTIDCEVCHIIGATAKWNPPEAAPTLRRNLPHCTPVEIPNGEHLVPLEMPDETFKAMQPFIERRMKRIQEIAQRDYSGGPNTATEREDFFFAKVEEAEQLFTSGKQVFYDRL